MTATDASVLLSPTTGKSPVHGRSHIKQLCFVDLQNDPDTEALKHEISQKWPDIEFIHSATGEEYIGNTDVVFYFKDFTGELFNRIAAENERDHQGARIVGPPYVKCRLYSNQVLYCPKLHRPLFSVQMASVIVILSRDLNREKKVYARHCQYLGGRVKKDLESSVRALPKSNQKTAVFVGRELLKEQRQAALLEMHTLKPGWIEYCWSRRFDPSLDVLDPHLLSQFAMGVFEGLRIHFVGFSESDVKDMTKNVTQHGGSVVVNKDSATHIVCDPTYNELKSLEITDHQVAITDNWLWRSLDSSRCLNEDAYFLKDYPPLCRMANTYGRVKSTGSLADCEQSKGSDDFSSDDLEAGMSPMARTPRTPATPKSATGFDKRQQVILELLETERNYINALNLALKLREMIEKEFIKREGEAVISKTDLLFIFGKLPAIINVHKIILDHVQAHVDSWDKLNNPATPASSKKHMETYDIADIWITQRDRLLQAYPPFLNSYENIKSCYQAVDENNSGFHAFIRSKESDPEFNRNKLSDLLIRPVQRLPSVTLLLKELQKRTSRQSQINKIIEATTVIQQILTHANQVRFKTDSKIAHLTRFIDMDKVPDHLVCSRRMFLAEMDAVSIIGTGEFQKWPKVDVRILLFNDVIVICKTRDQTRTDHSPTGLTRTPSATMSRLKKQNSLASLRKGSKKPLKYIKHIPIQHIRDIRELRDIQDNENVPLLYYPPHNGAPLMVITIREDTYADLVWVIDPADRKAMDTVFSHIHQHILMEFGRQIRTYVPYPLFELLENNPDIDEPLRKYLKKIRENNHNATFNYTMSRGGSMLRRAISSASMSVANRLSKITASRSNLREIMETPSHESSTETMRKAPNTPAYDMHPRIDPYSSPSLLESTEFATPKRGLRQRFSTLNIRQSLFRKPSIRVSSPNRIEEDKEN